VPPLKASAVLVDDEYALRWEDQPLRVGVVNELAALGAVGDGPHRSLGSPCALGLYACHESDLHIQTTVAAVVSRKMNDGTTPMPRLILIGSDAKTTKKSAVLMTISVTPT
jgi:hypothetical protein